MSHKQISHSPDLKRLRDEGYEIEIQGGHLLVHSIPLVTAKKEIALGSLVCVLSLAGDVVAKPADHTAYFIGEAPCDKDGNVIAGIINNSEKKRLTDNIEVDHYFSAKPPSGNYEDFYEKVITYVAMIESQAQAINPNLSAKTSKVIESLDPDIPFHYIDTNSSRAEIDTISSKLQNQKIAIIGLGGTGAYILDFIAKTPVSQIHLFDKDIFLSHNAFRSPGAASLKELEIQTSKVSYLHGIYSKMHKNIIAHEYHVTESIIQELKDLDFVFVCIDDGEAKKSIILKLREMFIPFIDVGIGINVVEGALTGSVRVTTVRPEKNSHLENRISLSNGQDDDYNKNIQIAEINALNASLAVIKWKKLIGFYHDYEKEHNTIYDIPVNKLINDENIT